MARETVEVVADLPAPADAVWRLAGDVFGRWHPWIETIEREIGPAGAEIRRFTVRGEDTVYRERLSYRSESDRVLAYTHLQGIAGAHRYDARLAVEPVGPDASRAVWSAEIEAAPARAAAIASGTAAVFRAGLDALVEAARAGTLPPPSPEPGSDAPAAADIRPIALAGTPRLALDVTPERPGPLCLFLHGIGGGRGNWRRQLALAAGTMRAAALDLRGYGGSTLGPARTTVDDVAADVLRVADALGAERLVLCGLSYGSWLATSFAMRHPDRLAGLVLTGGCTGMSEAGEAEREAFRASREVPLDAGRTPADFAPAVVDVIAGPDASPAVRAELLASMAAIPAATYRDALRCFTNPPERFDFARLTMPVLLMTGAADRLAPPAEIRAVAVRIFAAAPGADVRFEVLPGAGHVCNLEAPEAYDRHLLAFLKRLSP
jgi:pimeloyl-ACP methyl ester carboxylesterase